MARGSTAPDLEVGRETCGKIRMRFLTPESSAHVTKFTVGHCFVANLKVAPVAMFAAGAVLDHDPDSIKAAFVSGRARFRQNGMTHMIAPGSCVIFDTARPYILSQFDQGEQLYVHVPREMLSGRYGRMLHQAQAFHRGSGGVPIILESVLRATLQENGNLSDMEKIRLSGTLVTLLNDLLESRLEDAPNAPVSIDTLRLRMKAIINARFANPDFSIAELARRAGCSSRYVYRAFEAEETTPAEYLRTLRLEHARRHMPLSHDIGALAEIAYKSGFGCYAHFSRAFRAQYGVSPKEWRSRLRAEPGIR